MTNIERYEPRTSLELAPEAWSLAQRIARTEFVPDALRGKPEAVLACILAGHEVGISPLQSLQKIHVIKGRPAMAAELMRAIVLHAGHEIWIEESSSTRCIMAGKRRGSDRETRVTWTEDDARRANLLGKDNWKQYPTAMLIARASGQLSRAIFPDVLAGISYTIEELEDGDLFDAGEETAGALPPATSQPPPRRRAQARRPATRGSDAPEVTEPAPTPKVEREEAPLPGEGEGEGDDVIDTTAREPEGDPLGDDVPPIGEGTPPAGDFTYEGPDQELAGRSYSGPQIIAIKLGEFGVSTRPDRLKAISAIIDREIESSKDLSTDEVTRVIQTLNSLPEGTRLVEEGRPDESPAGDGGDNTTPPESEPAPGDAPSEPPSPPEPSSSSTRRRRAPAVDPEQWDAGRWRDFLKSRGVKVTELLREASRIAREESKNPVATVDDIAGSGIAADLVGFVEDAALERKEQ